jgi:NADPH:quinone reductase-like Zn-dependent oxidoreductase
MMTEYIALPEDALVVLPTHLSFEQGATLPCAAVTAWNALTGARPLRAGDTVLVLGSGGVSLFALQLARLFNARVIATTSSDAKAARLRELGAAAVLNYRTDPAWHLAVREITGGRGVDQVVDIGGSTLEQSIRATAIEGLVNFVGRLGDGPMSFDANVLYSAIATVRVVAAGTRAHFEAMNRAIAVAGMHPVIDRAFSFDDVPAAFRYFEDARPFGKVVIRHRDGE